MKNSLFHSAGFVFHSVKYVSHTVVFVSHSVKQRIEEAERLARITESDGAVLFAHWGCKGTIGASSLIKQSLEKTGLPTMILDGDGCNPANTSDGQVSTRLQAFVEMLEKGKEEKHA